MSKRQPPKDVMASVRQTLLNKAHADNPFLCRTYVSRSSPK